MRQPCPKTGARALPWLADEVVAVAAGAALARRRATFEADVSLRLCATTLAAVPVHVVARVRCLRSDRARLRSRTMEILKS